jgi:hypothetical protein
VNFGSYAISFYSDHVHKQFHGVWLDYSNAVVGNIPEKMTVLIAKKNTAEDVLYQGVCRTEAFNSGLIEMTAEHTEFSISEGDINFLQCYAQSNPWMI